MEYRYKDAWALRHDEGSEIQVQEGECVCMYDGSGCMLVVMHGIRMCRGVGMSCRIENRHCI